MKKLLLVALAVLAVPVAVLATPYVPSDQPAAFQGSEEWLAPRAPAPRTMLSYDPLTRYAMVAQFITVLQVTDTSSVNYGGMREGEHMLNVIQTDNTSESIWIWSHYYRLMGMDLYNANIAAAWDYCMSHQAYNEEGDDDPATGYYRRYNCGWALRAVMEYEDVYSDATYAAYGDSCASYLCHNPMILNYPAGAARRLNGMIMGWAVGNLYEYGQFRSNPIFVAKALATADTVKTWVDANLNKLHWKEWALEGGAVMWGIVHSKFADDPTGLEAWVATGAPYLDTEVDPTAGAYQNAWRAWAALGQSTATEVLDSPTCGAYFEHLADTLVANDGDLDGGIPVLDADPDTADQSWVTNYLGFMCMDQLAATAGTPAGGVIAPAFEVTASPVPSAGLPSLIFSLPKAAPVTVRIFDVSGRAVIAQNQGVLEAGVHRIGLDKTGAGEPAAAGIYFYEVRAGASAAKGKLVLVR